jgi:hypothetical protein
VDGAGYHPGLSESETITGAKKGVERALRAVGPDFANVLVDVCAFSKGIEAIEKARGLPIRSGKVVLGLALRALARHYGLANTATGADRQPIRQWRGEGARPVLRAG